VYNLASSGAAGCFRLNLAERQGAAHMGKVFFSVGMTLDGFMAPERMDLAHADDPSFKNWLSQWMEPEMGL
jgi:hypothetical protein